MAESTLKRVNLNKKITDAKVTLSLLKLDEETYAEGLNLDRTVLLSNIKLVIETVLAILLYILSSLSLLKIILNPLNAISFLAFIISGFLTTKSIFKKRKSFKERINTIRDVMLKYSSYDEIKDKIKSLEEKLEINKNKLINLTELIKKEEEKNYRI